MAVALAFTLMTSANDPRNADEGLGNELFPLLAKHPTSNIHSPLATHSFAFLFTVGSCLHRKKAIL